MPKANVFRNLGPELAKMGYEVLPICGKAPKIKSWQDPNIVDPAKLAGVWAEDPVFGCQNIGLRTGQAIMLDLDIVDKIQSMQIVKIVLDIAPDGLIRRRGDNGKCAILWRFSQSCVRAEATGSKTLNGDGSGTNAVEFFETNQFQMGIYSEGLEGGDYHWDGPGPCDVPFKDLAAISIEQLQSIRHALGKKGYKAGKSTDRKAAKFFGCKATSVGEDLEALREHFATTANWNNDAVRAVGKLIALGWTDAQILEEALNWTQVDYTFEETRLEISDMASRLRQKEASLASPRCAVKPQARFGQQVGYDEFRDSWVYVAQQNRYVHLPTGQSLERLSWKTYHKHLKSHDDASGRSTEYTVRWDNDPLSKKLSGETWKPGQPQITVEGELNKWSGHIAFELRLQGDPNGKAALLLDQVISFLCQSDLNPDREDIKLQLLQWIAVGLYRPEQRVLWAVLLISEEKGTGKSTLAHIISELYGRAMSRELDGLGKIAGRFQASLHHTMFVSVAELVDRTTNQSRFSSMESLKSLITDSRIEVEAKYQDAVMVDNYLRFMCSSNHKDGFGVDNNERRIFPIICERSEFLPGAVFDQLYELKATEQGLADIAAYLYQFAGADLPTRAPKGDMGLLTEALEAAWITELKEALDQPHLAAHQGGGSPTNSKPSFAFQQSELVHIARYLGVPSISGPVLKGQLVGAGFWHGKRPIGSSGQRVNCYVWGDKTKVNSLTKASDVFPHIQTSFQR